MKKIKPRDFRSLTEEAQAEIRRLAFQYIDQGYTHAKTAKLVGVRRETVTRWSGNRKDIEARQHKGLKRGRELYEQRLLTKEQEQAVKEKIEKDTPDKFAIPYALWSRKAIQYAIKQETGQSVWLQTVSKYTKRWGLTPQRPAKYAYEQDAEKIKKWLKIDYPAIVKEAKKNNAEIHWSDETGISLSTFYARSYAPKGKTPGIKLPARKGHISVIASITNKGNMRFMMYKGGLKTDLFIKFLERLIKDTDKMIYLIVDNLRVHKAKEVELWQKKNANRIKIFFPTPIRTTA